MKLIVIDTDTKFAQSIYRKFTGESDNEMTTLKFKTNIHGEILEQEIDLKQSSCSEIAQVIVENSNDNEQVIFINLHGEFANSKRQEQKGIEILKWLRLKNFNNHCIMYSFQSLLGIVKANPLNAILISKGVSFVQLPGLFEVLNKTEKAERENLLPYFKGEINLSKIRHIKANWFGMRRMTYWINKIFETKISISNALKSDIDFAMLEYTTILNTEEDINKYNHAVKQIQNQRRNYIKEIETNPPKVVYIDDMAQDGWDKILSYLIYNTTEPINNKNFKIIDKKQLDSLTQTQIITEINQHSPDLIIIDLRLKGKDEEEVHDYSKLLTFEIIKQIRTQSISWKRKFLIFTASNNFLLFKQMLKKSKNAPNDIFIKEGVDLALSYEQSLNLFREINELLYLYLKKKEKKSSRTSIPKVDDNTDAESYENIIKTVEDIVRNTPSMTKYNNWGWLKTKQIVIDTNIFLPEDSYRKFDSEFSTLKELFENYKKNIWLHSSVLFELKDINQRENGFTKLKAFTSVYIDLIEECRVPIVDKMRNYTARKDLADDYIKQHLNDNASSNNLILLSHDVKKYGPVAEAKKIRKKGYWIRYMYYNQDLKEFMS